MSNLITRICKLNIDSPDEGIIKEAGEIIKSGGLVAFPTETVYGLGGDALNKSSSAKIYEAKGRPSDNPLIVHICEVSVLDAIVREVPEDAVRLSERFWPGPLTMIFNKKNIVPDETTGGLDTVAVRMPDNRIALDFIKASGGYVAAPSANRSGRPSPTSAERVKEDLDGYIDMILDGGGSDIGLESTIVDMTSGIPVVLRPGFISLDMLKEALGRAEYDPAVFKKPSKDLRPKAPGMKYRHYAPKGQLKVVRGEEDAVIEYVNSACEHFMRDGKRTAVIASLETAGRYKADKVIAAGHREDEESIARGLYESLRECDDSDIDVIFSEEFKTPRLGDAIMNRLLKAAGYEAVEV